MTRLPLLIALLLLASPALAAPVGFPEAPEGWTKEEPANNMRKAQYAIKGDASLVVFHFGAMGGGDVDANVARWKGQVKAEDGDPEPKLEEKTLHGCKLVIYDQQGTYAPPQMRPMAPAPAPKKGQRVINAILMTGEGHYYFKLIGPKDVVAKQLEAFHTFLKNLELSGDAKPKDEE